MSKIKLVTQCALMGVGIFAAMSGLPGNNGAALATGGLLFGLGLHWYRKGLGFKALLTCLLMGAAFPLAAGAAAMSAPALGFFAFVLVGGVYHLVKGEKK